MRYDAIVIGVGGMGSATCYALAKRGRRVLGLEQSNIPNDLGSSHGVNRIIRLAYAEDPAYVPLLRRAYELWREAENRCGERLLVITGGIDAGTIESGIVRGSLLSCRQHHLPHEVLDASALRRRFPGYSLPSEMVAVYQPDGGFVLSERAIVAYVQMAQALGADIRACEPVLGWETAGSGVRVTTGRGAYEADRLVITAGPWASRMVPELARLARPERQVLIWTQPLTPEWFRLGHFPVFNLDAAEGRYYGFPVYGIPGFKFGRYHHLGEQVEPDNMERRCSAADEALLREGISKYFPGANGPTMAMKTCLFTNSPDEHFILDVHPSLPQVSIAAGFSGHGFKFCSVVGEIMADLACDGACLDLDISLFRLSRFPAQL